MGTPEKPTTRGTTRRLKATQDLQASDLKATDQQATDLEASSNYKSKPHNPSKEADGKMFNCRGCKQKFNKANIAKFCPQKNICRMCTHAQKVSDMEEQMSSVLHSRDQL